MLEVWYPPFACEEMLAEKNMRNWAIDSLKMQMLISYIHFSEPPLGQAI